MKNACKSRIMVERSNSVRVQRFLNLQDGSGIGASFSNNPKTSSKHWCLTMPQCLALVTADDETSLRTILPEGIMSVPSKTLYLVGIQLEC